MAIDYSFRRLIPGESKAERFVRIAEHIASLPNAESRALLEDGAQQAPWTCMVFARAVLWHSCLLPEDGRKVIRIGGKTFGKYGDDEDRTILGSMMYLGDFVDGRRKGNVLVLKRAAVFWQSAPLGGNDHVGIIRDWTARADGALNVDTAEGGQTAPHARKFTRTWRQRVDGRWDNTGASGSPAPGNAIVQGLTYVDEWPILTAPKPEPVSVSVPGVVMPKDPAYSDTVPSPTSESIPVLEIPPPSPVPKIPELTPDEETEYRPAVDPKPVPDIHPAVIGGGIVLAILGAAAGWLRDCF